MEYNHEKPDIISEYTSIGGGDGYNADEFDEDEWTEGAGWPTGNRVQHTDADTIVKNSGEFLSAIRNVSSGETIYIPGDAEITVGSVTVPVDVDNVTIASGRGYDGNGALIKSEADPNPLLDVSGDGFRLTGIRFKFPQVEAIDWPGYNSGKIHKVVMINGNNAEIDNCVFRGCGHAGVALGFEKKISRTHIHHNDFVDNPMDGLGYGVTIKRAEPLIQYCYFDNNKHSIAASGQIDCYYAARYNFHGPHSEAHCFDMHEHKLTSSDVETLAERYDDWGERDLAEGDYVAGRRFSIHHNIIMHSDNPAVKVRAKPLDGGQINKNWFFHSNSPSGVGSGSEAIFLMRSSANSFQEEGLSVESNLYGKTGPEDVGIPIGAGRVPEEIKKLREELQKRESELSELQKQIEEQSSSIRKFIDALKELLGLKSVNLQK